MRNFDFIDVLADDITDEMIDNIFNPYPMGKIQQNRSKASRRKKSIAKARKRYDNAKDRGFPLEEYPVGKFVKSNCFSEKPWKWEHKFDSSHSSKMREDEMKDKRRNLLADIMEEDFDDPYFIYDDYDQEDHLIYVHYLAKKKMEALVSELRKKLVVFATVYDYLGGVTSINHFKENLNFRVISGFDTKHTEIAICDGGRTVVKVYCHDKNVGHVLKEIYETISEF